MLRPRTQEKAETRKGSHEELRKDHQEQSCVMRDQGQDHPYPQFSITKQMGSGRRGGNDALEIWCWERGDIYHTFDNKELNKKKERNMMREGELHRYPGLPERGTSRS